MSADTPNQPRPRLAGSSPIGDGPSPGELPVVDGGGIPDLDADHDGITELEAAAMLASFENEPDVAANGAGDAAVEETIPISADVTPVASTPTNFDAIPMADIEQIEPPPVTKHQPSTIPSDDDGGEKQRFRAIGVKSRRHEDDWNRTPNAVGTGAIHVRTFMSKLTEDGFHALDNRVNEWLDAHPQYEVKFVNTSIGIVTGKLKEPHLICQVWV